jgi:hypothetical protein
MLSLLLWVMIVELQWLIMHYPLYRILLLRHLHLHPLPEIITVMMIATIVRGGQGTVGLILMENKVGWNGRPLIMVIIGILKANVTRPVMSNETEVGNEMKDVPAMEHIGNQPTCAANKAESGTQVTKRNRCTNNFIVQGCRCPFIQGEEEDNEGKGIQSVGSELIIV